MKSFFPLLALVFILFSFFKVFAQSNSPAVELKQLGEQGILLDKGWKFQVGDNPEWATPEFNDKAWQGINPAIDIHYLPQVRNAKICWLRLQLHIDSTLVGRPLALVINQKGASEIYLNSKLIKRFGQVSSDSKKLQTFNPGDKPVTFQFTGAQQVFAIRYAIEGNTPYLKNKPGRQYDNPCFRMRLEQPDQALENYITPIMASMRTWYFQFGIYLLLTVIHLFFFLYYPARKVNLYFAIYTFSESITFITGEGNVFSHSMTQQFVAGVIFIIAASVTNIFLLISVYKLFNWANDALLNSTIVFCILCIPFMFWPYEWGGTSILFSFIISGIGTIRISILAIQRKQPGATIVLIGQTISLLFFIIFALISISNANLTSAGIFILQISITLAFLCPPVFISILLAREFAQTNILLKKQLDQVERLSQKTIAQEKEKQKILASQNETLEREVSERTVELKQSLENLKATQSQLIQSEKMASLGELTAGIAHEIQNPLNFVNNFSEVNKELMIELKEEAQSGNTLDVLQLADEVIENEQKIIYHGQRADSIVKGMLQHSRASSGEKQLTDINALAEEYLRLAYQGFRAKNKEFNANLVTDFKPDLGKIEVIPQEIGRVLLNLYNNAFYATQNKKAQLNGQYQPEVKVNTCQHNGQVEIRVRDNGTGIPESVKNKIFQPFFTTKPTGQGTGLGLSLSYEIITKGHGGDLKVKSEEGEYSEFLVQLPA